jgi:putative CocE/NonD family hydrolase
LVAVLVCVVCWSVAPWSAIAGAQETAATAGAPEGGVDLTWGVRIPMRDGIHLNATIYRPHAQRDPLPVLLVMTPYVADHDHGRAMYFAQHGYVFALVDVRGRGNSEGGFNPGAHDGQDGYDTVEWLAKQSWSNGKVGMWGGSYMGFDQWATIKELPPHLDTIVPASAAHQGIDTPAPGGIFTSDNMPYLAMISGKALNRNLSQDDGYWDRKFGEVYAAHLPYRMLDELAGLPNAIFQTWLAHPAYDSYWKAMAPSPEQYAKIHVPILTITGDYDSQQPGAMSYYREHMRYGNATAKLSHYLIIGPWDHAGTRTPSKEVGGLTFGEASLLDMNDLERQWYDWTLKNGPMAAFLKTRVVYYVAGPGAEHWKYADDLESIASEHLTLYLGSAEGHANDVFHSGMLSAERKASPPDRYVYDPLSVPAPDSGPSAGGLVYTSDPFPEAVKVSGYLHLTLWMAMDVPDTDFHVSVDEVLPSGKSITLTDQYLRARYRESIEDEKLVTPGEVTRYDFRGFNWFARRISKGSRLRLFIESPNTMYLEKNYNARGVVANESGADARVAHITLYHDARGQSSLELPVQAP